MHAPSEQCSPAGHSELNVHVLPESHPASTKSEAIAHDVRIAASFPRRIGRCHGQCFGVEASRERMVNVSYRALARAP